MTRRLAASDFQVIWEQQQLGTMPAPLRVLPRGFTPDERRAVIRQAIAALKHDRLIDHHGELDQRFADLLHLLARPAKAIDARLELGDSSKMWAAASANRGVLGQLTADTVTLKEIPASGIAAQVVSSVPNAKAGYGRSVSVAVEALEEATARAQGEPRNLALELQRTGVSRSDAHHLVTMTEGARHRGQFRVLTSERGKLRPAAHVVGWWITDAGLYLVQDHTAFDGRTWRTVAPADHARLTGQIDRLLGGAA